MKLAFFQQMTPVAILAGLALPAMAAECSVATLNGDYGLHATGRRPAGPDATETHATISLRSFDGKGNITGLGIVSNGEISGVRLNAVFTGTYEVEPNCTGRIKISSPSIPRVIESAFVIVDNGREIKEVPSVAGQTGIALLTQVSPPEPDLDGRLSGLQTAIDRLTATINRMAIRLSVVP